MLHQSYGYEQLRGRYDPGTKIDGRSGVWNIQNYGETPGSQRYPLMVNGESLCIAGPRVEGTNPLDVGWMAAYCVGNYADGQKCGNAAALLVGREGISESAIIDRVRFHNVWDGIRPSRNEGAVADNFTIRNIWMSHVRDDSVENDSFYTGLIENSLFDGVFVFLSTRNRGGDGRNNIVTVRNNLVRLQDFHMEIASA